MDINKVLVDRDLPENVKDTLKKCLNKKVFYDNNGSCKVGTLKGIEIDDRYYYIVDDKRVPIWKSITKL